MSFSTAFVFWALYVRETGAPSGEYFLQGALVSPEFFTIIREIYAERYFARGK